METMLIQVHASKDKQGICCFLPSRSSP